MLPPPPAQCQHIFAGMVYTSSPQRTDAAENRNGPQGRGYRLCLPGSDYFESNPASCFGSVTGALQVKFSQT
jgi:hypothetical protein